MRLASACLLLLALLIPAAFAQISVADALRAPVKKVSATELPESYRAVAFGGGADGMGGGLSFYALMGMGGSGGRDGESTALFLGLMGVSFVDPDEFAELLEGKRPRIRAYGMDVSSMVATSARTGNSNRPPPPVFAETWIEAGRIVQWSPRPEITKAALLKVFGTPDAPLTASEKTVGISNAKQVAIGIMLYSGDCDDRFPMANSTSQAQEIVLPYLKNSTIWTSSNPSGGRLLYNTSLSKVDAASIESPAETLLLWDENEWPDGGRVTAYADGHVKYVTKAQWQSMWPAELQRRQNYRFRPASGRVPATSPARATRVKT